MHTTGTVCPPSLVILKVRPVLGDRVVAEPRWEDTALDLGTPDEPQLPLRVS